MGLRLYGLPKGENLGAVQLSIGAASASTTVAANQQPATVTGLPRINSGQADGDTLTIDAGGLTLTGYQWQELDGTWTDISGATAATYDTTGNMHMGKWLRCVTPEGTTPAVHIYMQMAMASHNADDVAVLALFPHDEATHIAITSGNWDTPATWLDGRVPRSGARVLAAQGVTITYDHDGFDRLDWLRIDGTLNWALDQDTKILCETIAVTRGGQMNCGTPGNRLPVAHTAEFMVSNRHYATEVYAPTDLGGGTLANDPTLVSRGILSQGSRVMWGAEKVHWLQTRCTFELLTTLSGASETTVVLTESIPTTLAASGVFQVIDDDGEYIDLTYTSYTGATLTITSADFSTVNATAGNVAYISFAPKAGDTQFVLESDATGWQVDDLLVIGGTNPTLNVNEVESEEVLVTAVAGGVVTFAPALSYTHDHKNPSVTRADLQPAVANMTRNIKIYGEDGANLPHWRRGHTMDMHSLATMDLWEVEHYDLGRTEKNMLKIDGSGFSGKIDPDNSSLLERPTGVTGETETVTLTTQSNLQSRYPVHAHITGRNKAQVDTVNGCTVRRTPGWGIVHHQSEAIMNDNCVFDFKGSGMVAENGGESGEWIRCLSIFSRNRIRNNGKVLQGGAGMTGDDMRWGYGFAFRGRPLRFSQCMAMDCTTGANWMHRQLGSITPSISPFRDNLDFPDLQGLASGGAQMRESGHYPLIHAVDFEAAGCIEAGMYVSKANPSAQMGLIVNIKRPKVWATTNFQVNVEYIQRYIIENPDLVAFANGAGTGVLQSTNSGQVAVVGGRMEGFNVGYSAANTLVSGNPSINPYGLSTDPISANAGTKFISCNTDVTNIGDSRGVLIDASLPAIVEPTHNLPFIMGTLSGSTIINYQTGTQIDTMNAAGQLPPPNDNIGMPIAADTYSSSLQNYLDLVGGYDVVDGVNCAVFPLYIADRYTGVPVRTLHAIDMSGQTVGKPLRRTWSRSANTITVNSGAPVPFAVAKNGSTTVDVLALATDTASATLSLVFNYWNTNRLVFWNPENGRLSWDGGANITYTPDRGYTGSDFGWVFIEDDIGNCKRVDLEMTVT